MVEANSKFTLIQGGKKEPKQKPSLRCAVCNGAVFLQAVMHPVECDEAIDGQQQLICAQCLAEGRVEPL